ncbi:hypothetical protein CONPUDRAFT_56343 [Coniophora puteana RWD-64-598 SS2]|uniref:Uncharacterized protein n=1 Tax=Coniophora puteana (strain RWD-64-598) TaxID=741705 RepID=A0A5M3MPE3_CONPW|nr:uncharacterized protein CONPUDRAFT_56343 [Coniophora puteana RWD-64-598 SS2]EIW80973.1 hypothetical protein CONPUDRAFT_56343 [Coniophora puteana RWD-64-598 SS2]
MFQETSRNETPPPEDSQTETQPLGDSSNTSPQTDDPRITNTNPQNRQSPTIEESQRLQTRTTQSRVLPASPLASLDLRALARRTPLEELQRDMSFVIRIRDATLDDGIGLKGEALRRLRDPPQEILEVPDNLTLLGMQMYDAMEKSSEKTYNHVRASIHHNLAGAQIPSLDDIKKQIANITGIEAVEDDMCVDGCVCFTGPLAGLDSCPDCRKLRWDEARLRSSGGKKKIPRAVSTTFLLGPMIQTNWRHPDTANKMKYRRTRTREIFEQMRRNSNGLPDVYDDIITGSAYLQAVREGKIRDEDTVFMLSIDGAQLSRLKESTAWIYVIVLVDLSPGLRYKKRYVLPGGIIPGPHKPKYVPSFLFTGMHHISALQKEPLAIWDSSSDHLYRSYLFNILTLADGPGLLCYSNMVGHNGKYGCRVSCDHYGRRITGSVYYPALLAPDGFTGDARGDIDPSSIHGCSSVIYVQRLERLMGSQTRASFNRNRLETGIVGPSLLLGLQPDKILGIPENFTSEIMHFCAANMAELWKGLWTGEFIHDTDDIRTWHWAVLQGDTWVEHGLRIVATHQHLPISLDKLPRNPEQRGNSGYKAQEYNTWLYCLCPALLFGVLPLEYWRNFCLFVKGLQIMHQFSITPQQLLEAKITFDTWELEFERIYYKKMRNRLHLVRPCVHLSHHLAPEAARVGPPMCSSQYPMERTIGNLKEELRQPSNPFANLAKRGLRRAQLNAVKAMMPDFDISPEHNKQDPAASCALGDDYLLLFKRAKTPTSTLSQREREVLFDFHGTPISTVLRWARLRIPTGQIARSLWGELSNSRCTRRSRNVKVRDYIIFDVSYRSLTNRQDEVHSLALVQLYSKPHARMLELSNGQVYSSTHGGEASLCLIDVKSFLAVVGMVPHTLAALDDTNDQPRFFLAEKMGLDVLRIGGVEEPEGGEYDGVEINEEDY